MKILVISQFFPPDVTAAAFRISDMVRLLAARGHDLTVLTSFPHKATVGDAALDFTDAEVLRCKLRDVGKGGAVRYIRHYLSFVTGSAWRGVKLWFKGYRPDVVWVSSPPLFVGITARFLSVLYRRPFVLEVRDLWPDTAIAAGQLPATGIAPKIGRILEKYLYRSARRIVCVAKPMAAQIESMTRTPVEVAYNGIGGGDPAPLAAKPANRPRRLVYTGNMGLLQELDLLVGAFHRAVDKGAIADWELVLIGGGAQAEDLRRQVADLGATDIVTVHPPVSRDEAQTAQNQADLLYLNLKKHPVLAKTIPSKVFDYMLAGRPIVAGIMGEGVEILAETGANVTFEPGNPEALEAALIKATNEVERLETHAAANRDLVLARFTREAATDILERNLELARKKRNRS